MKDELFIYGESISSRMFIGSSLYPSLEVMQQAIQEAAPGFVTLSLRRQNPQQQAGAEFWQAIQSTGAKLLPNTAGCKTVSEAVNLALMSRELFATDWIKLELIGDDYSLQPDPIALLEASEILLGHGFKVLPYCTEDLVIAQRLVSLGCDALMPWAAPIGTGLGPVNPLGLKTLRHRLPNTPLIVDAGLGLPSHACQVMELGYDAVLLNTAVAKADNPVDMARAFRLSVDAGRLAYRSGAMAQQEVAMPSTPVVDMPFWHQES